MTEREVGGRRERECVCVCVCVCVRVRARMTERKVGERERESEREADRLFWFSFCYVISNNIHFVKDEIEYKLFHEN